MACSASQAGDSALKHSPENGTCPAARAGLKLLTNPKEHKCKEAPQLVWLAQGLLLQPGHNTWAVLSNQFAREEL